MSSLPKPFLTPEAYLAHERTAAFKSEYLAGETCAMAGASERHALIVTNLVAELRQHLKDRPCRVYSNDLRVKASPTGLYTYPDVVVVCGEARFDDEQHDTLLNPTLIVEVLSESTRDYDRGGKFVHYRALESLQEYVLVAQGAVHVEHFARREDGRWLLSETNRRDDVLDLASVGCRLAVAEVYHKVEA